MAKIHEKFLIFIDIFFSSLYSQYTNLDCQYSNIGTIGLVVENTGNIGAGITGGQCDISKFAGIQNEYPLGSGCTHGRWGLWVGAKRGTGSTVGVSTGGPHCNPYVNDEFFPTAEPWDTVWTINKDEIVDIPYWNNYTGISHQDIVTRFSDYFITSPNQICLPDQEPHNPLYIEVISATYIWSGLDAVIYSCLLYTSPSPRDRG